MLLPLLEHIEKREMIGFRNGKFLASGIAFFRSVIWTVKDCGNTQHGDNGLKKRNMQMDRQTNKGSGSQPVTSSCRFLLADTRVPPQLSLGVADISLPFSLISISASFLLILCSINPLLSVVPLFSIHPYQHFRCAVACFSKQQHLRKRRIKRELHHLPSERSKWARVVDGTQHPQLIERRLKVVLKGREIRREQEGGTKEF